MNQAAVCFVLVLAVQCLAFAHAQSNFSCSVDSPVSQSETNDVRVVTSTSWSTLVEEIDWSQDDLSPDEFGVSPLAGDHDLILGECDGGNYNRVNIQRVCVNPSPDNGTSTFGASVMFNGVDVTIVCIKMLDLYDNAEGEDLGGYPNVTEGGIGYNFVHMVFTSQPGEGMVFRYELYAFEPPATTTAATTTDATSTTAKGGADAVGMARGNWLVLSAIVLISKCVFTGN